MRARSKYIERCIPFHEPIHSHGILITSHVYITVTPNLQYDHLGAQSRGPVRQSQNRAIGSKTFVSLEEHSVRKVTTPSFINSNDKVVGPRLNIEPVYESIRKRLLDLTLGVGSTSFNHHQARKRVHAVSRIETGPYVGFDGLQMIIKTKKLAEC